MDISLVHAGLAAGAALAAVPLILHLFMKQTPKHVIFPALRLIRERHKRSKKRLKVKNWLLLAARMLLLALMALALARPRLNSEMSLGDQEVPMALALVFDTSMSMQYTERGSDRLAEAKLRANEILKKTKDDSEVFVIDSASPVKEAAISPAAARKRIEGLALKAANQTLNAAVVQANQLVAASALPRREVYVLTDLAGSAWDLGSTRTSEDLEKVRKGKNAVKTYVLRLTPKEVNDVAIVSAEPVAAVATEGEPLEIRVKLRNTGKAVARVAEFYLDGENNKRDQKPVELPANDEKEVSFFAPAKLEQGLHQGRIKLGGVPDPLAFDDVRYFSFQLEPSMKVLIVADVATEQDLDAFFVKNALAPAASIGGGGAASPFKVDRETRRQFQDKPRASLKEYAAIFLLNLDRLESSDWGRLTTYVREGGGLVVAPGQRADVASYDGLAASGLLPATLEPKPSTKDTVFGKVEYGHPLFHRYARELDRELPGWPIYRYWPVKPVESATALVKYADGGPALLERTFHGPKTGHVLLWTTPLTRRALRDEPGAWNEFPQSWAFVALTLQTIPYLAGTAGERLNYPAGDDAILAVDPARRSANYTVQGPDPKVAPDRLSSSSNSDTITISSPQKEGQWRVEGVGADGGKTRLGFSVNVPESEASIVALKPNDLDGLFGGKDNYKLADSAEGLRDAIDKGRIGVEIFPWLMFLILALVTAESILANKFHRDVAKAP